jgi:hypothetical protein
MVSHLRARRIPVRARTLTMAFINCPLTSARKYQARADDTFCQVTGKEDIAERLTANGSGGCRGKQERLQDQPLP